MRLFLLIILCILATGCNSNLTKQMKEQRFNDSVRIEKVNFKIDSLINELRRPVDIKEWY